MTIPSNLPWWTLILLGAAIYLGLYMAAHAIGSGFGSGFFAAQRRNRD